MSQHDYVLANQSGSLFRTDLNNLALAIVTNNAGGSAPSSVWANMWWADPTSGKEWMKLRNAASTGWLRTFRLTTAAGIRSPVSSVSVGRDLTAEDFGTLISCTAAITMTTNYAANAVDANSMEYYGNGYWFALRNDSAGTVTFNPYSTELVDGASTLTLAPGESTLVQCDGSAWKTVGKAAVSQITNPTLIGTTTLKAAGAGSYAFIDGRDHNNVQRSRVYLGANTDTTLCFDSDGVIYWRDLSSNIKMTLMARGYLMVSGYGNDTESGLIAFDASGDSYIYKVGGGSPYFAFYLDNAYQGYMQGTSLSMYGNVIGYVSDGRLKVNVEQLANPLERLHKLRGVSFDWLDDGPQPARGHDIGLIAQDCIAAGIPEAVAPAPFDFDPATGKSRSGEDYLTIKTGQQVIALLVEAVKELSARVEALERRP